MGQDDWIKTGCAAVLLYSVVLFAIAHGQYRVSNYERGDLYFEIALWTFLVGGLIWAVVSAYVLYREWQRTDEKLRKRR